MTGRMRSKLNSCLSEGKNDDGLLPELYSSLDEINRHLRSTTPATAIKTKDNCDISSSTAVNKEANNAPHLFLHFDVNETILLGDPAGGDSVHECMNKIIAKSAFVSTRCVRAHSEEDGGHLNDKNDDATRPIIKRSPSSGNIGDTHQFEPTHWWNGEPLDENNNEVVKTALPPPLYTGWVYPPNTCPYYRTGYKRHAKKFTLSSHGRVYRPLYERLSSKMGLGCSDDADGCLDTSDVQQQPMGVFQNFLPAFWIALMYYFPSTNTDTTTASMASFASGARKLPPPPKVTLVLRTFGHDLPRVAIAISEFAKGNHPDYSDYRNEDLILVENDLYCSSWSYRNNNRQDAKEEEELVYSLHRANDQESETPAYSGDDDILNFLQSKTIVGIQDNYPFWKENNFVPWAGKPVWTNTSVHGHNHHHVLLDDNIHNDPSDGAGGIRIPVVVESGVSYNRYESLHGEEALELHGRHLIRVPTIRPSLEDDWFIRQIEMARCQVKQ